jgi:hypothetical protein
LLENGGSLFQVILCPLYFLSLMVCPFEFAPKFGQFLALQLLEFLPLLRAPLRQGVA